MATTDIQATVLRLTSVSPTSNSVEDAQRFVVQSIPKNLLRFAEGVSSASTDGSAIEYLTNDSIIEVQRNGFSCMEIPFSMSQQALDTNSLYCATVKRPVYWQQSDGVKIAPDTTAVAGAGYVHFIDYSKVDDSTDLRNAVIFHSAASEFTKLATDGVPSWDVISVPIPPSNPDFGIDLSISSTPPARIVLTDKSIDTSNWTVPSYSKPAMIAPSLEAIGSLTLPSPPSSPVLNTTSVSFSQAVPSYTSPIFSTPSLSSIGNLTLPALPISPSLSTASVSFSESAPSYAKPIFSVPTIGNVGAITLPSVPVISALSTSSVAFTEPAPTYTKPVASLTATPSIGDLTISSSQPVAPTIPSFSTGTISVSASPPSYIKSTFSAPTLGTVGALTLPVKPTIPASPSFTYDDASVNDIIAPIVAVADMASLTASAPSFQLPIVNITTFPSLTWDVGSGPIPPSLSIKTVGDFSSEAPTYTTPVLTISSKPIISPLNISSTPPVAPTLDATETIASISSVPTYTAPIMNPPDWTNTDYWIDTEEDNEMLNARIQEINAKVSEFSARLQQAGAEFGAENTEFQKDIQIAIENAKLESAVDSRAIQDYGAKVQLYQQEVMKEVQEYQQNFTTELQLWQTERQTDIQKHQQDTANALNNFNKETVIYQSTLQEKIKNAELENSNDANLLQKFSGEITNYQAEVNRIVNSNTAECNCWQQENALYIQKYGADIQANTAKFNEENVAYQEDIGRETQNFKKEFDQAIENAKNNALINKGNVDKDIQIELQNAINNFQQNVQEYTAEIQKFSAEVGIYKAETDSTVQKWLNEEWNQNFQKYQLDYTNKLQEYGTDVQQSLNAFNQEQSVYQLELQEKVEEAKNLQSSEGVEISSKIQKYASEIQSYQADIGQQVQEYTINEIQKEMAIWNTNIQSDLQKYASDIQNELNVFQKESASYQAQLQISIKDADLSDASDSKKIQKYQAELGAYQQEVAAIIQKWTQEEWTQNFQKYQTDYNNGLQEYATNIQNELNFFQKEGTEYQALLQIAIKDSELSDSADTKELQKYQAEVSVYQAEVASIIQKWTAEEWTQKFEKYRLDYSSLLQEYQSNLTDALNSFNEDQAVYQAELQVSIKNADLSDNADSKKLQIYQQDLASYQAEVGAIVQKWTNEEWTQKFQKYQTDYASILQQYQVDVQNELNEFNKENVSYQAEIQKSLKEADISEGGESQAINKYTAELNEYQQNVNNEVQDYVNSLSKKTQEYQSEVALYTAEIQKYQSQSGDQTQKNTMRTQNVAYYSKEADRCYQMAVAEVQRYISNNEKMIQSTMAAQAAQQ